MARDQDCIIRKIIRAKIPCCKDQQGDSVHL